MTNNLSTRAVHAGEERPKPYGAVTTPIVHSSTYAFADTAEILDFMHRKAAVEGKVAVLEGGERALLFASGMSPITTTLCALLASGDHLVMVYDAYHRTREFAVTFLQRRGIETTLVPIDEPDTLAAAIRPTTRLIFSETPTNPYSRIIDLSRTVDIARQHSVITIIDSTFATPINLRPLEFGVDLVIHSATKFLGGHNDLLAGVVVGRMDILTDVEEMRGVLGGVSNPHDAYLLLRSLKTLKVRVLRQNHNAQRVAQFLDGHLHCASIDFESLPDVEEVTTALEAFSNPPQVANLPSSQSPPIIVHERLHRPQPILDRLGGNGMSVSVGRVRECAIFDVRMVLLGHNTLRGSAGGSIHNAELLVAQGWITP